ncbi:ATP-dependent zinc metalloprotease FtsH [Falsiroseomonas sp.]|uniref:ATP-dependent zinc metalloprotease FtsH n=1 Tax=Falsiroseomonas sp. TaxID=2870721 RepID=UPI003562F434
MKTAKRNGRGPAPEGRNPQFAIWYFIGAVVLAVLVQAVWAGGQQGGTVPWSEFERLLAEGRVAEVTVSQELLHARLTEPLPDGRRELATVRVDPALSEQLRARGVTLVRGDPPAGALAYLLAWLWPLLLLVAFWTFATRSIADRHGLGGLMSIGRSRAKAYVETDTKVTFADVAGVDEAKAELQEVVSFLKDPQAYGRLGGRAPKGVLLVGPPGTGKTLLARAVAGEASVPFFSISGSEFVEMFVGVGAARVRDLFAEARKAAPCIIFIDELDALGRSRAAGGPMGGGYDEKEQTLNQLLAELDGFDPSVGVILLAATNRPEILDPALLRAGRFDRQVLVDRPDRRGRRQILEVHARRIRLAPEADLDTVASLTPGATGADLANTLNEAALAATRRGAEAVAQQDLLAAVERVLTGIEQRSRVLSPAERHRVAVHEMGHALVAAALPGVDPVLKVSIIPRGVGALGFTMQRPTGDRFLLARSELENRITVLMGGRAAEALIFNGDISTGAADDLQRATEVAQEMVTRHAMAGGALGSRAYAPPRHAFLGEVALPPLRAEVSEETTREIDLAVRDVVNDAARRAEAIVEARRAELDEGVRQLLERETLTADDFAVLRGTGQGSAPAGGAREAPVRQGVGPVVP